MALIGKEVYDVNISAAFIGVDGVFVLHLGGRSSVIACIGVAIRSFIASSHSNSSRHCQLTRSALKREYGTN